jgi:hypothetical protein
VSLPLPHHHKKSTQGVKIVAVNPHVLGQAIYPLRKEGDLNFGGAGVLLVKSKVLYNGLPFFFFHFRMSIIT